ncbi:regulatory LuxR family protein [Lentzea atacamensis]|uniref:Regulatory LuxR family protein n=1 Tax=Lentzea atacamensis TaxID=531938 RepID=A0ABX9EIW6_9PSEU|nr:LuxR C-terminal-related transcriptional regulator [Lentzea atacamensis]RAS71135.1 regulatory LuxR family protein [Lentzea atacamensis]
MISARLAARPLSEATVKMHLNRAMAKLGLSSRTQVVAAARESGLLKPGS